MPKYEGLFHSDLKFKMQPFEIIDITNKKTGCGGLYASPSIALGKVIKTRLWHQGDINNNNIATKGINCKQPWFTRGTGRL